MNIENKATKRVHRRNMSDAMIDTIMNKKISPEKAGQIGRNLWRRGLDMVTIRRRVEREEATILERRRRTIDMSVSIAVPNGSTIRSRIQRRK